MNVLFVGVGAIGLPMAVQIQKAGHQVVGIDVSDMSLQKASEFGIPVIKDIGKAPPSEVVIVMVATPQQLNSLISMTGPETDGQTWVIMSTVGPECVQAAAEILSSHGASVIDAPVTGGTARAKTGELMIFASGRKSDIESIHDVLSAMGTVNFIDEDVGKGQAVKIINQHLCSIHLVAAAEALNLSEKLGLNPSLILPLISKGAAASWMLSDRGPRMLRDTDVEVLSSINIFVKDSGLVSAAAKTHDVDVPLLDVARARYVKAANAGLGNKDDSRVIDTWD